MRKEFRRAQSFDRVDTTEKQWFSLAVSLGATSLDGLTMISHATWFNAF